MWYLEMPGTKWFQITDFLQALVKGGQQMRIGSKCLRISTEGTFADFTWLPLFFDCHF